MQIKSNFSKTAIVSALSCSAFLYAAGANATDYIGAGASATLIAPVGITQSTPMSFGNVVIPSSGTNDVVLNTAGSITSGQVLSSTGIQPAAFGIYAETGETVVFSATDTTTEPGVSLSAFTGEYGVSSGVLSSVSGAGSGFVSSTLLYVGATMSITTAATAGGVTSSSVNYTLTADYQ